MPESDITRLDQIAERAQRFMNRFDTDFASWFRFMADKERQKFKKYLKGKTLIDLGSGLVNPESILPKFAKACGVANYIGVDASISEQQSEEVNGMSFQLVHADMLSFLARQESASANITVNGITDDIISPYHPETGAYLSELRKQILRVLPVGGLLFGYANFLKKNPPEFEGKLRDVVEIPLPAQDVPVMFGEGGRAGSNNFVYEKTS